MSTANAKHAENRRKLTRAEKKEIAALIRAAKGDGKAHTAQQTIPYLAMYPDGICKVTEKEESDCRSHFFNKMKKEYLKTNSNNFNKQNYESKRSIEVTVTSPQAYEGSF